MKPFPTFVLAAFLALALFGVFIFATFNASRQDAIGTVTIWGALPQEAVDQLLTAVRSERDDFGRVSYRDFPPESLVPSLVTAIAAGRGPDLVIFPSHAMVKDGDKLQPIPYTSVSRRSFQDTFVQAGEIFLTPEGVAGLPLTVDPMVMYWNRTLLANAGIARPPRYWDEITTLAPRLSKKAPNGTLTASAAPLGGWDNIAHAKAVLVTLMTQLGAPVIRMQDGSYEVALAGASGAGSAAESSVSYWVDFADPVKPMYSWNRSQKNSREAFLAGALALYFGPASDLRALRAANPNLNFDVAPMPAARGAGEGALAEITALAVPRGAPNPSGATTVALVLVSKQRSTELATSLGLPSPRRDVELDATADAYRATFRTAALQAFSFPDPNPTESDAILGRMIDSISSGRQRVTEAIRAADDELRVLLRMP